MATIVEMINPLTGLPEQVDKLDHTAQEIDDAVGLAPQLSNPNLLDNWYFGNPVNQRGVASGTEWEGNKYSLDRWASFSVGVYWDSNGYIVFPPGIENNLIYQRLEKSKLIVGSKITLSLLTDDGNLIFNTVTYAGNTIYGVLPGTVFGNSAIVVNDDYVEIRIWYTEKNASEGHLAAAKLELGSQQTLAHQDADGNWVLNEIPDYGEQLARCQRYFRRRNVVQSYGTVGIGICTSATLAQINVPRTPMRINPSVSVSGAYRLYAYSGTYWNTREIKVDQISDFYIRLNCTISGGTPGQAVYAQAQNNASAYIDEIADL